MPLPKNHALTNKKRNYYLYIYIREREREREMALIGCISQTQVTHTGHLTLCCGCAPHTAYNSSPYPLPWERSEFKP